METSASELVQLKLTKLKMLEDKQRLREGLPHLHGWKFYAWAREFFESTNKQTYLCAANQISKSSTQIRKCIEWACNKELWPLLWRTTPRMFWYLYPARDVATIEFETKWRPEFLPANEYKNHPHYGWKEEYNNKFISAIHFNSGVTIYFKTYAQDAQNLQTGTCHAIFCDEELPEDLYDELQFRLTATDGYFSMVFTATIGQDHWYKVIERRGMQDEKFPEAAKWQVSMYDCLEYDDKTLTPWTVDKIKRVEAKCKNRNEVLRRVYGRFVKDEGQMYPGYNGERNRKGDTKIPEDWHVYSAVDVGSGGSSGHPAAIVFVGVSPKYNKAKVFKAWRGDGISTTASDVLLKYLEMRGSMRVIRAFYDWASKDFWTIAARMGEPFEAANKNHELGEQTLNALFKNDMLDIAVDDPELDKLEVEISTLSHGTDKRKAKDDLVDAMRYAVTSVPWNWVYLVEDPEDIERAAKEMDKTIPFGGVSMLRRNNRLPEAEYERLHGKSNDIEQEFEEINGLYG